MGRVMHGIANRFSGVLTLRAASFFTAHFLQALVLLSAVAGAALHLPSANATSRFSEQSPFEQTDELYLSIIHAARAMALLGNLTPEGGRRFDGRFSPQEIEAVRSLIVRNSTGLRCSLDVLTNELIEDTDALGPDFRDITQVIGDTDTDFLLVDSEKIARLRSASIRLQDISAKAIANMRLREAGLSIEHAAGCTTSDFADGGMLLNLLERGATQSSLRKMRLEALQAFSNIMVPYAEMLSHISSHAWIPSDSDYLKNNQSPNVLQFEERRYEEEYKNFMSDERRARYEAFEARFNRYEKIYRRVAERLYSLARVVRDKEISSD